MTRDQVLLNAEAAAVIEEPVSEQEAATFEAVHPVKIVAAAVPEAVGETAPVEPEAGAQVPTPVEAIPRLYLKQLNQNPQKVKFNLKLQ